MKKYTSIILISTMLLVLTACGNTTTGNPIILETPIMEVPDAASLIEQAETDTDWDRIPMVMVNGKLYYDTGSPISGLDLDINMDLMIR